MTCFVIEDDPASARILEKLLLKEDFAVKSFERPQFALEHLKQEPQRPDLVICDWEFPEFNGLSFGQALREVFDQREVYFMMVTVRNDRESLARAIESGFNAFLSKPIDPIEFRAHLNAAKRLSELRKEAEKRLLELTQSQPTDRLNTFLHEINTPLSVVLNRGEKLNAIVSQTLSEKIEASDIQTIQSLWEPFFRNLSFLKRACEGQLAQLRKERRKASYSFAICEVMQSLKEVLSEKVVTNQVTIDWPSEEVFPDHLLHLKLKQSELEEVLLNLISNAVDALSKSPLKWIGVQVKVIGHEELLIEISDSGPGLSENQWLSFAKPYQTTKIGGTGLGLFVSRQIIEGAGGKLSYLPKEDGLTCFQVQLPLVKEAH